ncbi:MAG: trypsin-like peptidase domain-containing protein [Andreesenia angusta]|nr:trypsin-like peptidase domain-containing protein [Andreesenia angusta]
MRYNSEDNYERDYEEYYNNSKKYHQHKKKYPSYVLISMTSGIIGALIFASVFSVGNNLIKNKSNMPAKNITIAAKGEDINITQAVADKAMDSVVGIITKEIRERNDIFTGPSQSLIEGTGSGVIVSDDGYILTNSHVIANNRAEEIKVLFKDGSEKDGRVIWNDNSLDLAVIKVEAKNLRAADLGDSDKLKIGETAIAIGNPLGLEFERTVTSGIVSGLNRSLPVQNGNSMEGLIQTDASINSGNSGGPLLNSKGQVIGINTLKLQSVEGMGFAQPINTVKSVIDEIKKNGGFEEAYIGIYGEDVLKYQKITGRDLGTETGVLITQIANNSPAEQADLKPGDIILNIEDQEIKSLQGLKKELYKYKPGEKIFIKILRDKAEMKVNIDLSRNAENLN